MQLFPCPFCGARDETEFFFAGEAGHERPQPAETVSDATWAAYLYTHENPKGQTREIWIHLTCHEAFILERDTATHAVTGSQVLPHWPNPEKA